ncbi:MAG: excisionase family DNA-binding protein [Anaerolineales bacterium]|nr:excisionase family DNA-binding protein [Anaerolineales bacterium]
MTDDFNPKEWITTHEAAELTGYTAAYFRQLLLRGRLRGQKRGRDWFLDKQEVLDFAAQMRGLGPAKYDPWRSGTRRRDGAD